MTNQIAEAPLHWKYELTSIYQVSVSIESNVRMNQLSNGAQNTEELT